MNVIPFRMRHNPPVLMNYRVMVDGFVLETIRIPVMSQNERDEVRADLARKYHVPTHYIRLQPMEKKYRENI